MGQIHEPKLHGIYFESGRDLVDMNLPGKMIRRATKRPIRACSQGRCGIRHGYAHVRGVVRGICPPLPTLRAVAGVIGGVLPGHDLSVGVESAANLKERRGTHGAPHELFRSTVGHANRPARCFGEDSRFLCHSNGALGAKGAADLGSDDSYLVLAHVQRLSQLIPHSKRGTVAGPDG